MPYKDKIALGLGETQFIAARYAQNPPALEPETTIDSGSTLNLLCSSPGLDGIVKERSGSFRNANKSFMSFTMSCPVAGGKRR